jgi:hypothetical protein
MKPFSCRVHDIRKAVLIVVLCLSISPATLLARSTILSAHPLMVRHTNLGWRSDARASRFRHGSERTSCDCRAVRSLRCAFDRCCRHRDRVQLVTGGFLNVLGDAYVTSPSTNNLGFLDGCDGTLNVSGNLTLVEGRTRAVWQS